MNLFCQPMGRLGLDRSTGFEMIPKITVDPANESKPTQTSTVTHRSNPRAAIQSLLRAKAEP